MLIAVSIFQLLCAAALILSVLFQSGNKKGLGAISGSSDSFSAKGKSSSLDTKLQKVTVVASILFVIATIALNIIVLNG